MRSHRGIKFSQVPVSVVGIGDNFFRMLNILAAARNQFGIDNNNYQLTADAGFTVLASYLWTQGQYI